MASNTPNLSLLKKDPLTDGNETFNIQTMMNDNWDKIDTAVKKVQDDVANIDPDIPDASTTQKGIVQLSSATNSASETLAATAKAVKTVADASLPKTGGTISGDISISGKSTLVGPVDFRNGIDGVGDIKTTGNIRANGTVNFTNRLFVGSGDNNGQPSLSLSIGDNDTGFNHARDGYVDFVANGRTVAFMNEYGRFCVRGDGDDYYDVARDIINLKQSGVNVKNNLVYYLNAAGIEANAEESFDTLLGRIGYFTSTRYKEAYTQSSGGGQGSDLTWTFPAGFNLKMRTPGYAYEGSTSLAQVNASSGQSVDVYARDYAGREILMGSLSGSSSLLYYHIASVTIDKSNIVVTGYRASGGTKNPINWSKGVTGGFDTTKEVRFVFVRRGYTSASNLPSVNVNQTLVFGG